ERDDTERGFAAIVIDGDPRVFEKSRQFYPIVASVVDGVCDLALGRVLSVAFIEPAFELIHGGSGSRLSEFQVSSGLRNTPLLRIVFDAVYLLDQCHGVAHRLISLASFKELATRVS